MSEDTATVEESTTTPSAPASNGAGLDQLAANLATAEAGYEEAIAALSDTRKMAPEDIVKASVALQNATTVRDRAKSAYDRAKFDLDNAERLQANVALADWVKANIADVPEFATAVGLGSPGFSVRRTDDGTLLVDVFGAKAPGGSATKRTPKAAGDGTPVTKPQNFIRNRHTSEEQKSGDWLLTYGDEAAIKAVNMARSGGTVTKDGKTVPVGFQQHLKRVFNKQTDWVLVRKFKDGTEEIVEPGNFV